MKEQLPNLSSATMDFQTVAGLAREILPRNGWDANTDNWFRNEGLEMDFRIEAESEEFTLERWWGNYQHKETMPIEKTVDWLERWDG